MNKIFQLHKILCLLTTIVTLQLATPSQVAAQGSIDREIANITKIENSRLLVIFKNGTRTLRKGSKGLNEVKFYKAELIESVVFSTDTATTDEVTSTPIISLILNYIKAGDFTAETPFMMTPQRRGSTLSDNATMAITLFDGQRFMLRGYEIARLHDFDARDVASTIYDLGNGITHRTTYGQNLNYQIREVLVNNSVQSVELITRSNYILEDGVIIVTHYDGRISRYDGTELDLVKKIDPLFISKIEIVDNSTPQIYRGQLPNPLTDVPAKPRVDFYDLSRDQIMVINRDDFKHGRIVAYRRKDCTEVDYIVPIFYSKQWISSSSESYLIDPTTEERYKIIALKGDIPMDRYARIIEQVGHTAVITCIYPPIPEGIEKINLLTYQIKGQSLPTKSGGMGPWLTKDITVLDDVEREYKDIELEDKKPEMVYYSKDVDVEPLFRGLRSWQTQFQSWVNEQLSAFSTTLYKPNDARYPSNISKFYGQYNTDYTTGSIELDGYVEPSPSSSQPSRTSVKVLFTVDRNGGVHDVKIISSPSEIVSKQVAEIIEHSSGMWSPATINGESVAVVHIVEIDLDR